MLDWSTSGGGIQLVVRGIIRTVGRLTCGGGKCDFVVQGELIKVSFNL